MKKIAILGSGIVGQTLASGLLKHGYEIVMGTEHPDKQIEWNDPALSSITLTTYEEAAENADSVIVTVKGSVAEDVVKRVSGSLAAKTVIDTTNPIADAPPVNGVLSFFTNLDESLFERLQKAAPEAHFVKAFNSVGSAAMVNPAFETRPTMFICGNVENAKQEVSQLLDQFGWEAEDMGAAEAARAIEPLCILWCIPGFVKNDWYHAFKLLRK